MTMNKKDLQKFPHSHRPMEKSDDILQNYVREWLQCVEDYTLVGIFILKN